MKATLICVFLICGFSPCNPSVIVALQSLIHARHQCPHLVPSRRALTRPLLPLCALNVDVRFRLNLPSPISRRGASSGTATFDSEGLNWKLDRTRICQDLPMKLVPWVWKQSGYSSAAEKLRLASWNKTSEDIRPSMLSTQLTYTQVIQDAQGLLRAHHLAAARL